jgi:hypothetical protein
MHGLLCDLIPCRAGVHVGRHSQGAERARGRDLQPVREPGRPVIGVEEAVLFEVHALALDGPPPWLSQAGG